MRKLIALKKYQDGEFLPPENELSKQLGVSRNTIRQATNKLELEGLIVRKKGYGTKVAESVVTTQLNSWHSFTQEMNEKGIAFKNYSIEARWVEPDEKISTFFKISNAQKVVQLSRIRGDKKAPFVYFESYFHPRVGITPDENFSLPLYDLLEEKFKTPVTTSQEKISARLASQITAKRLNIKPGEPVLVRERFVFDPGNRPV